MNDELKRTITTIEQVKIKDGVVQRIATHIVTEYNGYSTLCTYGNNIERDDNLEKIRDCEVIAKNQLPVTCPACMLIWQDINGFTVDDFKICNKSDFVMTDLEKICLPDDVL